MRAQPIKAALLFGPSLGVLLMPTPAGLGLAGHRVLIVLAAAIASWGSELLPSGVTSLLVVAALAASGGVRDVRDALAGFADPAPYFLIGVLTLGLAVSRCGLAERIARHFLRRAGGRPGALYGQLLSSFPLLTLMLPSASTRTAILVHVYDHALELASVPRGARLAKALMLALNSVNRLSSTILLTGGITPVVAAGLIGGVTWTRWLVLMGAPYLLLLAVGAAAIYILHRPAFRGGLALPRPNDERRPLTSMEWRTIAVLAGASLLWLSEGFHHLHAAVPALLACALLLTPRIGVLGWKDFERKIGWSNFLVIGSSLSLAKAIAASGASAWLARSLLANAPMVGTSAAAVVILLLVAAAVLRLLIPNIAGFLATAIPLATSLAEATRLNPLLAGLIVTIAGDAVLYYPAQSSASLTVYERGHLTAGEIFRFGVVMTFVAALVVAAAIPYWKMVGEPLR